LSRRAVLRIWCRIWRRLCFQCRISHSEPSVFSPYRTNLDEFHA
jgi:hypothetical protein